MSLLRIREAMDGTVVEQLAGIDLRPGRSTPTRRKSSALSGPPRSRRAKEIRHHFEMSLFGSGKALNEGFFYLVVDRLRPSILFINGRIILSRR